VKGKAALPELSITREKHEVLVRTAHYFLRERHLKECPLRFDVVAIDNTPGKAPIVRLHKAALSPRA
jgi:Holliday junction resolvase-like predicted endonuclease